MKVTKILNQNERITWYKMLVEWCPKITSTKRSDRRWKEEMNNEIC